MSPVALATSVPVPLDKISELNLDTEKISFLGDNIIIPGLLELKVTEFASALVSLYGKDNGQFAQTAFFAFRPSKDVPPAFAVNLGSLYFNKNQASKLTFTTKQLKQGENPGEAVPRKFFDDIVGTFDYNGKSELNVSVGYVPLDTDPTTKVAASLDINIGSLIYKATVPVDAIFGDTVKSLKIDTKAVTLDDVYELSPVDGDYKFVVDFGSYSVDEAAVITTWFGLKSDFANTSRLLSTLYLAPGKTINLDIAFEPFDRPAPTFLSNINLNFTAGPVGFRNDVQLTANLNYTLASGAKYRTGPNTFPVIVSS